MTVKFWLYPLLMLVALLLSLWLPFSASLPVQATTPSPALELTKAEITWLQVHPVIKVSNEMDWPPFDYVKNGQPAGYSIDLMNRIAQLLGVEFEYVNGLTWDELLTAFKNKEIDLLHCVYYTEERTEYALFTRPYFVNSLAVFARADAEYESFTDLVDKTGVIPTGFSIIGILEEVIPNYQGIETNNMVEALQAIASGKADYTVESFAATQYMIRENAIPNVQLAFFPEFPDYNPDEFALRVATAADEPLFHSIIQKALDSIPDEDISQLKNKWFGSDTAGLSDRQDQLSLSVEEQAYLSQKGKITMCLSPDWRPIEWVDDQGEAQGIVAELMQLISQRLNHPIERIPTPTRQQTIRAAQEKRCDFISAINPSQEQDAYFEFTPPYQDLEVVVATRRQQIYIQNLTALNGEKVGIVGGSIYQQILKNNYPGIELVAVADMKAGLKKLQDGAIAGFVDNLISLAYFIQEQSLVDVKISGRLPELIQLHMGVRKDDQQLYRILSKALESISPQQRQDIANQWIAVKYERGRDYQFLWRWLGGALVIVAGIFYWNRQLAAANRQIRQLNERLEVENVRMGAELDVAQRVQQMILPKQQELAAIASLDLAVYMTPAAEVGGDYYDVLLEAGVVTIGIGDVTGHGLESGLVMLMAQTTIRTLTKLRETDPVRFLSTVNATLYDNVQRMGVDRNLSLSILNYTQNRLTITGQHEHVLLVRANGELKQLDTLDLGMTIALVEDIAEFVAQATVELQPGDGVVLYTDGISEARNTAGDFYGIERLCLVIQRHWHYSAQSIKTAAIANVQAFVGKQAIMDDMTLLVLKQR
ncbi:MAG: transporter substrate-binding domain-containing protein [Spirulina sp. SIO3F2]|nr:transporter substrate-binding domain-containing protein [Spirulina sp. SIO3F2]